MHMHAQWIIQCGWELRAKYQNFGTFHMHAIAKGAHACHSCSTAALNRSKSACRIHWARYSCRQLYGQSEHFTAKIEVASQLRDKVLEVPCGATRRVSRAFGRRPHRAISAKKGAGSGTLYRHFECGRKARGFLASRWRRSRQLAPICRPLQSPALQIFLSSTI